MKQLSNNESLQLTINLVKELSNSYELLNRITQPLFSLITLTPTDIAKIFKISRTAIYTTHRYLLPNYGKTNERGERLRYSLAEVVAWNSPSEIEQHKANGVNM